MGIYRTAPTFLHEYGPNNRGTSEQGTGLCAPRVDKGLRRGPRAGGFLVPLTHPEVSGDQRVPGKPSLGPSYPYASQTGLVRACQLGFGAARLCLKRRCQLPSASLASAQDMTWHGQGLRECTRGDPKQQRPSLKSSAAHKAGWCHLLRGTRVRAPWARTPHAPLRPRCPSSEQSEGLPEEGVLRSGREGATAEGPGAVRGRRAKSDGQSLWPCCGLPSPCSQPWPGECVRGDP